MNKTTVFAITDLGKALLEKPPGRITGDAKLVMALVDGKASVAEIAEKTPPSVRIHLTGIFDHLLSFGVIEEKRRAGTPSPKQEERAKATSPQPQAAAGAPAAAARTPRVAEIENMRRMELERELDDVRAQLEATIARQKRVEDDYARLTYQVQAGTEQKKPAEKRSPPSIETTGGATRVGLTESMKQLNQALLEKQEILSATLRLRAYQAKLASQQEEGGVGTGEIREGQAHPHYRLLRGLDFFKGFSNKELIDFLSIAKWREVNEGTVILNEGEIGMSFYIIMSGAVDVFRKDNLLTSFTRGDFFGEFAHLSGEEPVRSARVVATSRCELLAVDPLDVEFAPVQLRLRVVEALLRGEVKRALVSDQRIDRLSKDLE